MSQKPLTFRSSKVVYYGPHPCENCGILIAKMGPEFGATAFTYPSGPIYPNTEWAPHVCDPFEVRNKEGREARERQIKKWPQAHPLKINEMYVIAGDAEALDKDSIAYRYPLIISHNMSFYDTELAAWKGADDRDQAQNPTWHVSRKTGNTRATDEHNEAVDAGFPPPSAFYPTTPDDQRSF